MCIRQCGYPQRLNDGIRLPGTRVNRQCELPNMTVGNAYMFSSTVFVKYNTTVLWELGMNPEPPPTHKCTHFLEMVPIKFANYLKAPMFIHSSPHPVTHPVTQSKTCKDCSRPSSHRDKTSSNFPVTPIHYKTISGGPGEMAQDSRGPQWSFRHYVAGSRGLQLQFHESPSLGLFMYVYI